MTIGTVGRAYALVRERGLVSGEVGRGTFVLGRDAEHGQLCHLWPTRGMIAGTRAPALPGKLRMDSTSAPAVGQSEVIERLISEIVRSDIPTRSSTTRASGRRLAGGRQPAG